MKRLAQVRCFNNYQGNPIYTLGKIYFCDTITMLCLICAEFPKLMIKHGFYASRLAEK